MIACCIFDLDGVVVDTARYHYLAWRELAAGLGFDFTPARGEATRGVSRMASLEIVLAAGGMRERFTPEEKERLAERKNARYLELIGAMTPSDVLPGVREFLGELCGRGVKVVLGSSSKNAGAILDRCALRPLFDAVVDGTLVTRAKPDPEVFVRGAEAVGLPAAECVVFEDAAAGVEAARRAGMRAVGVGCSDSLAAADLRIPGFAGFTLDQLAAELRDTSGGRAAGTNNRFIATDGWKIVETRFDPGRVRASESLFAIGNGVMGGRANFEESYSGPSLQGNYIGGVYYPDKTRVGWWKNGYPDYFAKVPNAAFWPGVGVRIDGEELDLARVETLEFYRELDMRRGVLRRRARVRMGSGAEGLVEAERFLSRVRRERGAVRYAVTPLDRGARIELRPFVDADVRNADANYDEKFWEHVETVRDAVRMRTAKSGFEAAWAQCARVAGVTLRPETAGERVQECAVVEAGRGERVELVKCGGICSSLNHAPDELIPAARSVAGEGIRAGFGTLLEEQARAWEGKWRGCDVEIEGDAAAQQGIRYCIFMLLQTYTGVDSRLNIGPKGFTGEKYGGVTYWDTEAYCLPFYLATAGAQVARALLVYRYNQLDKAIENAAKLGFRDGAALYPMVTVNGEECHNEWEITFEEIHRNGAIAYAIHNYIRYIGEQEYLARCGLEVLLSIARFWAQRITWSEARGKYVMLGVTGPNEYENNVDNNWYTSYIACWSMRYAAEAARWVRENRPEDYRRICAKRHFDEAAETARWTEIADRMYLGEDPERGIFLQQDGYLDKEQRLVRDLDPRERPLNRTWSWDRILRSCFIKQADVLQGLYFFGEHFDTGTVRRNFRFYEARTVHESSLSPCVHAILAARLGEMDKAYEMYLRTARLDLDDYNREVEEGLHVTSMAGSWLAVVEGFGGMRMRDGVLDFSPVLPAGWRSLTFRVNYRERLLTVRAEAGRVEVTNEGAPVEIGIDGCRYTVADRAVHMR